MPSTPTRSNQSAPNFASRNQKTSRSPDMTKICAVCSRPTADAPTKDGKFICVKCQDKKPQAKGQAKRNIHATGKAAEDPEKDRQAAEDAEREGQTARDAENVRLALEDTRARQADTNCLECHGCDERKRSRPKLQPTPPLKEVISTEREELEKKRWRRIHPFPTQRREKRQQNCITNAMQKKGSYCDVWRRLEENKS